MARDHRKLRVFQLADELVIEVYRITRRLLREERFGLQAQLRRAAVSSAVNIVEGSARRTTRDYLHFLSMSLGSASETRYLLDLACRLELLPEPEAASLATRYTELIRGLQRLMDALRPEARNP